MAMLPAYTDLPEEREKVFKELQKEITERPNVTDMYAVYLLFKLELRIGELVALKWQDIDSENREIHIHRMETLAEDNAGKMRTVVAEYTKKKSPYGDRFYLLEIMSRNCLNGKQKTNTMIIKALVNMNGLKGTQVL